MKSSWSEREKETASLEDYLKVIFKLSDPDPQVQVTAISEEMNIKKPSVTSAVSRLKEKGFVEHKSYGPVILTKKGQQLAEEVKERHEVLFQFFTEILEVDKARAEEDACQIEHYVSERTLEKISKFVDFLISCPRDRAIVLENFKQYVSEGTRNEERRGCCGD